MHATHFILLANGDAVPCILLLLMGVAGGVGIYFFLQVQWHKSLNDTFSKLADHFHGEFVPGAMFSHLPQVSFHLDRSRITVYPTRVDRGYQLALVCEWPGVNYWCEIVRHGFWSRLGQTLGTTSHFQTGNRMFDRSFLVKTNDPEACRGLLVLPVQQQLQRLEQRADYESTFVRIEGSYVTIRGQTSVNDFSLVRRFTSEALALFRCLSDWRAGHEGEIEFVGTAALEELPICKICGEPIEEEQAVCRKCNAPHHRDCWQYAGRCSIYGCGSRQYHVRPPTKVKHKSNDRA